MPAFVIQYEAKVGGSVLIDAESAEAALKWVQDEAEIEELTSNSDDDTFVAQVSVLELEPVADDDEDNAG